MLSLKIHVVSCLIHVMENLFCVFKTNNSLSPSIKGNVPNVLLSLWLWNHYFFNNTLRYCISIPPSFKKSLHAIFLWNVEISSTGSVTDIFKIKKKGRKWAILTWDKLAQIHQEWPIIRLSLAFAAGTDSCTNWWTLSFPFGHR